MGESLYGPGVFQNNHESMAAPFEIHIAGTTEKFAVQASQAAFAVLDLLNAKLSKYQEMSDISRVNALGARESVSVSLETMECLQIAAQVHKDTGGAFDITVRKAETLDEPRPVIGMENVVLDPERYTVRLKKENVRLDLGGVGKGYALDKMWQVLQDWEIENVLLSGGDSTILAIGTPPDKEGWAINIASEEPNPIEVFLSNRALSASGTRSRGQHILDPKTARPARGSLRAWAACPTGGLADALSTAFMVMNPAAVGKYCEAHTDTYAVLLKREGEPLTEFGKRP